MDKLNGPKLKKSSFSRKEEIKRQATIMFKNRGYSGASVRDLAQQAGIEAPSIYSHFKSKEDILRKICLEMAQKFMKGLKKAEQHSCNKEKLKSAIASHIKIITKNLDASAVMWNEWKHLKGTGMVEFKELKQIYEDRFHNILEMGMESGDFHKNDPKILSNLIFSALNGISFWYHGGSRSKIIDNMNIVLFNGIIKS